MTKIIVKEVTPPQKTLAEINPGQFYLMNGQLYQRLSVIDPWFRGFAEGHLPVLHVESAAIKMVLGSIKVDRLVERIEAC